MFFIPYLFPLEKTHGSPILPFSLNQFVFSLLPLFISRSALLTYLERDILSQFKPRDHIMYLKFVNNFHLGFLLCFNFMWLCMVVVGDY